MRCKNCGWAYRPGETVCVKCGSPLDNEVGGATRMENVVDDYSSGTAARNIGATIPEGVYFGNNDESEEENVCPKCGYPLTNGAQTCPNCNYVIAKARNNNFNNDSNSNPSHEKPIRMENPNAKKPVVGGTINPYMVQTEQEPTFTLKPQQRLNEKKVLAEMEYEGEEVMLNRDNTEPENGSITSQQQAVIVKENGRWYIEDKSEQGTTFVRASNKIELNDGDIILLGNRLFEFHA